jgi:hypothetical protein
MSRNILFSLQNRIHAATNDINNIHNIHTMRQSCLSLVERVLEYCSLPRPGAGLRGFKGFNSKDLLFWACSFINL